MVANLPAGAYLSLLAWCVDAGRDEAVFGHMQGTRAGREERRGRCCLPFFLYLRLVCVFVSVCLCLSACVHVRVRVYSMSSFWPLVHISVMLLCMRVCAGSTAEELSDMFAAYGETQQIRVVPDNQTMEPSW